MADLETDDDYIKRLEGWVASLNPAVGGKIEFIEGQCRFATGSGVDVVLSPAPEAFALFFSAVIGQAPPGEDRALTNLMAKNLFHRETAGGWFAFEPNTRGICYQYRWDRYPLAEIEEFLVVLNTFIEVAEVNARDLQAAPQAPADAANDINAQNSMLRL